MRVRLDGMYDALRANVPLSGINHSDNGGRSEVFQQNVELWYISKCQLTIKVALQRKEVVHDRMITDHGWITES